MGVEGRLRGKGWVGRSGGLFREMEFVPKARYEDCGEERDDDL